MKTYQHLYPDIVSFENLYWAFKQAARAKRGKPDVAEFEFDLEDNLLTLQAELISAEQWSKICNYTAMSGFGLLLECRL